MPAQAQARRDAIGWAHGPRVFTERVSQAVARASVLRWASEFAGMMEAA